MTEDRYLELSAELQRLDINHRLEAANAKLATSNAKMVSAILTLTVVIDGLLPHIVGEKNADIVEKLWEANRAARDAAIQAAEELAQASTELNEQLQIHITLPHRPNGTVEQ